MIDEILPRKSSDVDQFILYTTQCLQSRRHTHLYKLGDQAVYIYTVSWKRTMDGIFKEKIKGSWESRITINIISRSTDAAERKAEELVRDPIVEQHSTERSRKAESQPRQDGDYVWRGFRSRVEV